MLQPNSYENECKLIIEQMRETEKDILWADEHAKVGSSVTESVLAKNRLRDLKRRYEQLKELRYE